MPKPNIAIITGTRAEFGIWTPILHALQSSQKLRLQLIVTGMHLQKQFGHTIDDIRAQGFPIAATVPMYAVRSSAFRRSSSQESPAQSLARATAGLAAAYQKLKPDLVMVLGDRLEILAAANTALASQIPLAHLHGGETAPAQWDEQIRHAVTKIAHLHFPATKLAAKRIQQMGEDPKTIHPIGAPALDTAATFLRENYSEKITLSPCHLVTLSSPPRALLLLHPSSPNDQLELQRTLLLLRALENQNLPFLALGPNNDPGHPGILRAYRQQKIPLILSLPQNDFFHLLATSSLLIGNSSAGILEAATFGCAVINLGDRQKNRERNPNVIDVPWSAGQRGIVKAIRFALTNPVFRKKIEQRKNLYGTGQAAPRLLKILESLKFPLPTTKSFADPPQP